MSERRDQLRATVTRAHTELAHILDSLSREELDRSTSNEGWTGKDVLAHLSSIEARLREQVHCALQEGAWAPPETIDAYNAHKVEERERWTVEQLRSELDQECASTLALLDGLPEDQFDRAFDHPRRGRTTAEWVFLHIAEHVETHAQEISAAARGR